MHSFHNNFLRYHPCISLSCIGPLQLRLQKIILDCYWSSIHSASQVVAILRSTFCTMKKSFISLGRLPVSSDMCVTSHRSMEEGGHSKLTRKSDCNIPWHDFPPAYLPPKYEEYIWSIYPKYTETSRCPAVLFRGILIGGFLLLPFAGNCTVDCIPLSQPPHSRTSHVSVDVVRTHSLIL